jgi:hypothetical protein
MREMSDIMREKGVKECFNTSINPSHYLFFLLEPCLGSTRKTKNDHFTGAFNECSGSALQLVALSITT